MEKRDYEAYFHEAIKNGAIAPEELEGLSDFALSELADRMAAEGDRRFDDMVENEIDDMRMADSSSDCGEDSRPTEEEFNLRQ